MVSSALSPILVFTYNRPKHTLECLKSLSKNKLASESTLYIFSDGKKEGANDEDIQKISETRNVIKSERWCKEVIIVEQKENKGLAQSVIDGVTEVIRKYGSVIVLEDDIISGPGFLQFMNDALEKYKDEKKVFEISGFNFPIKEFEKETACFFLPIISSWGWGTWERAWNEFDPSATGYEKLKTDGLLRHRFNLDSSYTYSDMLIAQMETKKINSWAVRWLWTVFKNDKLTLFPPKSYVINIGFGDESTHTKTKVKFTGEQTLVAGSLALKYPEKIIHDEQKLGIVKKFLTGNYMHYKTFFIKRYLATFYYSLILKFRCMSNK